MKEDIMNIFLTSGTPEFMETVRKKHKNERIFIMHGEGNTVLLHESARKSVFATPRSFEVLEGAEDIEQRGFFALLNFPITDDADALLEQRLLKAAASVTSFSGLISYRFLKPVKHETYIVLTQWAGPASFELWQNSDDYKALMTNNGNAGAAMFVSKPYVTKYTAKPIEE